MDLIEVKIYINGGCITITNKTRVLCCSGSLAWEGAVLVLVTGKPVLGLVRSAALSSIGEAGADRLSLGDHSIDQWEAKARSVEPRL
jgi:hypothetical protein